MVQYVLNASGYFDSIGGKKVVKRPVPGMQKPSDPKATDWLGTGHPIGIVFHYTVGCQDDIYGTLAADSFGGAQFNVGTNGTIYQYAPVGVATYHCFHESHFFWGIEHTAYPGKGCELNSSQLEASAALSAALVDYAHKRYGTSIPLTHWPNGRANDYRAGFHDHRDFVGDGSNDHNDHLYGWSWAQYLNHVSIALNPPKVVVPPKVLLYRRIQYLRARLRRPMRRLRRLQFRAQLRQLIARYRALGSSSKG